MEKLWLISNPASGTTSKEKCDALEAIFEEKGMTIAGRTSFPEQELPAVEDLIGADTDTVVLFAGDGTINAAACKYDKWEGKALILPGGTMNILAKQLHGDADPHAIVHAAHEKPLLRTMPCVQAGRHRAFVGVIVGPAAMWGYAREAMRYRRFRRLRRAVLLAWSRTWTRGVSLFDGTRRRGNYRAVMISPEDGWLRVSAFKPSTLGEAARLGWEWLLGNWHNAPTVDDTRSAHVTVSGSRALHALFDGEEVKLTSPARISAGMSNLTFVATVEKP